MAENWLDAIVPGFNTIQVDGTTVTTAEPRSTLNLTGGLTGTDNPTEDRIDVSFSSSASLYGAAVQGEVSAFGATANTFCCSDGATAGGVWRSYLAFGTAPPPTGTQRWSDQTFIRGLDVAGVGTAPIMDWGATTVDHLTIGGNDADLDGVDIVAGATGQCDVRVGAATNLSIAASSVTIGCALTKNHATDQFAATVANPTIGQVTDTTLGGAMTPLAIAGRSSTVAGSTGAQVSIDAGDGVLLGGALLLGSGSGATAGIVGVSVGATRRLNCYSWGDFEFAAQLAFASSHANPTLYHYDDATPGVTCDDFTLAAQGATDPAGAGVSGNLGIRGGQGSVHAGNLDGNVWFHAAPASWNSAEKGMFVGDCVTPPAGNPASGVYIYSQGGAAKVRGSGGTVTTFGPAAPHCAECGYDFWSVVAENERFGARLLQCGWCGHTHREGPETVHHLLSADELASRI